MIDTKNNNIIVKEEARNMLKDIEAVVFDIDGVLIDVSKSFRVTIGKAVQYFFIEILKYEGDEQLVKPEEIQLFKDAGGFNNDWELTESLALFYIAKSVMFNSRDLAVLRFQEPFIENFIFTGVKEFEYAAFSLLEDNKDKKTVQGLWNKALIRQIFQEMYAGREFCNKFYGYEPAYIKKETGTIKEEVSLIDKSLIDLPVAILSGRAQPEVDAAMKLTGLSVEDELIVSDNGRFKTKPNPQSLEYLSDKMNINLGIYIGDVMDDLLIVKNYNKKKNSKKRFLSAMVTKSVDRFKSADIIAQNVNDVLRLMRSG
ncbi:MAG: hypothetical protein E3J54_01450 [Actinobacteria bacterium]|nr:MAG: hypothetical protein E3J54_01450 [Actinomycetota bacterium]